MKNSFTNKPNKICYRCQIINNIETPLPSKGDEHIIQNSLGGRLKSKYLLCDDCNGHYGKTIDKEVREANQLHTMLGLSLDRGKAKQSLRTLLDEDGLGLVYHTNGKVTPHIKNKKKIIFNASNPKIQNKYPNMEAQHYVPAGYSEQTGGIGLPNINLNNRDLFFKGLLKIAVNFYVHNGGDFFWIADAIKALEVGNKDQSKFIFAFPCKMGEVYEVCKDEISHVLYLYNRPKSAQLLCFLELYNCYSFLVNFNNRYYGPKFSTSHCIDLVTLERTFKIVNTDNRSYGNDYVKLYYEKAERIKNIPRLKSRTEKLGKEMNKKILKQAEMNKKSLHKFKMIE